MVAWVRGVEPYQHPLPLTQKPTQYAVVGFRVGSANVRKGERPREGRIDMGYFDKFVRKGIPFMEGREKGNLRDMVDKPLHIVDFGFINGKDGEFGVVQFAEDDKKFYFANGIITEMLMQVDDDGMREELAEQPIVFTMRMSKERKQEYMTFDFV